MEQLPAAPNAAFLATLPINHIDYRRAFKDPERIEIARTGQIAATIEQHLLLGHQGQTAALKAPTTRLILRLERVLCPESQR